MAFRKHGQSSWYLPAIHWCGAHRQLTPRVGTLSNNLHQVEEGFSQHREAASWPSRVFLRLVGIFPRPLRHGQSCLISAWDNRVCLVPNFAHWDNGTGPGFPHWGVVRVPFAGSGGVFERSPRKKALACVCQGQFQSEMRDATGRLELPCGARRETPRAW